MAATYSSQHQFDLPSPSDSTYSDEFPSLYTSLKTTKLKKKSKKTFTLAEFANYKPPPPSRDRPRVSGEEKRQDLMEIEESICTGREFGCTGIFSMPDSYIVTPLKKPPEMSHAAVAAAAAEASAKAALDAATAAYAAAKAAAAAAAAPRPELTPEMKASLDYLMRDISAPDGKWKPESPPDVDNPMHLEFEQKMMSEKARKALEYYEDVEGEEFELVEIKDYEPAILPPFIIDHLTFMAKPRYLSDSCHHKLFFAEVYERFGHEGDYEVKMCMTMDPFGPDVMKGCGYVQGDEDMLHPKNVKFWAGPPSGTPEWDEEYGRGSSSLDAR